MSAFDAIRFLLRFSAEWEQQKKLNQERHNAIMANNADLIRILGEVKGSLVQHSDSLSALGTALADGGAQLEKAKTEIINALNNSGNLPQEALTLLDEMSTVATILRQKSGALADAGTAIKTVAQQLDDLNPDTAPPPPPDQPPTPEQPPAQ